MPTPRPSTASSTATPASRHHSDSDAHLRWLRLPPSASTQTPTEERNTTCSHPALLHRRPGRSTTQVRPSQCPAWPLSTSSHLLRSQLLRTSTGMQRSAAYTKVVEVLPGGKKHLLSSNLCDDLG